MKRGVTTHFAKFCWAFGLYVCVAWFATGRGHAQVQFRASGTVQATSYIQNLGPILQNERKFSICVSNSAWIIRTTSLRIENMDAEVQRFSKANPDNKTHGGTLTKGISTKDFWHEVGCDGFDTFCLTKVNNETAAFGAIEPSPQPYPDQLSLVSFIWLAFGSHNYLANSQSNTVRHLRPVSPVKEIWYTNYPNTTWQKNLTPPYLPASFNQFAQGITYRMKKDPFTKMQSASPIPLLKPYDNGYKSYDYIVINWTNFSGISLPSSFKARAFLPKAKGTLADDLFTWYEFSGQLEAVGKLPLNQDLLPLAGAASPSVVDYRFKEKNPLIPVIYSGSNHLWRSRIDPELISQSKMNEEKYSALMALGKAHKIGIRAKSITSILIMTLVAVLVIFFYKRSNPTQPTNQ